MEFTKCDSCGYVQGFTTYKCAWCADGYNLSYINEIELLNEYKKLWNELEIKNNRLEEGIINIMDCWDLHDKDTLFLMLRHLINEE